MPGGNPRTGSRAVKRVGGGRGVQSIRASSEACPGQEGPRAPAVGDCLPATLGGVGGWLGRGLWPPAAHVALPSEPGAGRTSAPTGRKLLMRAWRPGPGPVQQPGAKGHPCSAQCLLLPGAWLVAQLEVVPVPPGLCSPPSVVRPTGGLEAERGSREERLSGRQRSGSRVSTLPLPSLVAHLRGEPTHPCPTGRKEFREQESLGGVSLAPSQTEGGTCGPGGMAGPWKKLVRPLGGPCPRVEAMN